MIDMLLIICNKIWQTGEWPTPLTQSLIITLPKKGNLQLCLNYRTISLMSQGDEAYITDTTPDGYQFLSFPRRGRRGGGIALVSKCSLKSISVKRLNYQSFEAVEAKLFSQRQVHVICLFVPISSQQS